MSALPCASDRGRWVTGLRCLAAACAVVASCPAAGAAGPDEAFRKHVEPLLDTFCVGCHSGPEGKGKVAFDKDDLAGDPELWQRAIKMLRSGMMPPKGKPRPTADQVARLEDWV